MKRPGINTQKLKRISQKLVAVSVIIGKKVQVLAQNRQKIVGWVIATTITIVGILLLFKFRPWKTVVSVVEYDLFLALQLLASFAALLLTITMVAMIILRRKDGRASNSFYWFVATIELSVAIGLLELWGISILIHAMYGLFILAGILVIGFLARCYGQIRPNRTLTSLAPLLLLIFVGGPLAIMWVGASTNKVIYSQASKEWKALEEAKAGVLKEPAEAESRVNQSDGTESTSREAIEEVQPEFPYRKLKGTGLYGPTQGHRNFMNWVIIHTLDYERWSRDPGHQFTTHELEMYRLSAEAEQATGVPQFLTMGVLATVSNLAAAPDRAISEGFPEKYGNYGQSKGLVSLARLPPQEWERYTPTLEGLLSKKPNPDDFAQAPMACALRLWDLGADSQDIDRVKRAIAAYYIPPNPDT